MKNIITIIVAIISLNTYAQEKKNIKYKTTSLTFTVDSTDEVKKINWDDTKEFFEDADKDEEISLGIKIKKKGEEFKSESKHNFLISGNAGNIDQLIKMISNYEFSKTKVEKSSLVYTVESIEELKEINWNEVKESLKDKDENEEITLGCKVKGKDKDELKFETKQSFIITGKIKDLDKLINIMSNYTKNQ
ncbi:hypothetical protein BTO06_14000 [Tenacibaculum sp. SZ-18]|uniref:hypothetical protein n=1 Tax=Tenacibaculum sp. SZ-18 TaxID=754423 RepID=UPI000C2CF745|nr:hypothetical protein [Tenacibaculum sp. SZ-18]AUC16205.1 hypothetical protein BTO06_14000 [Tenacibaculum sp. SZ-18]